MSILALAEIAGIVAAESRIGLYLSGHLCFDWCSVCFGYFKCYSFGLSCSSRLYGSCDLFNLSDSFCWCSMKPDSSCRSG